MLRIYTHRYIYIYIYIERSKVGQHNVDQNDKISSVKVIYFGFSVNAKSAQRRELHKHCSVHASRSQNQIMEAEEGYIGSGDNHLYPSRRQFPFEGMTIYIYIYCV